MKITEMYTAWNTVNPHVPLIIQLAPRENS